MQFILSEKLNQDNIEAHFGIHRRCSGTVTNPTLYQFGYQENKIRMQKYVKPPSTGNTSITRGKKTWYDVDNEPLSKRVPVPGLF